MRVVVSLEIFISEKVAPAPTQLQIRVRESDESVVVYMHNLGSNLRIKTLSVDIVMVRVYFYSSDGRTHCFINS